MFNDKAQRRAGASPVTLQVFLGVRTTTGPLIKTFKSYANTQEEKRPAEAARGKELESPAQTSVQQMEYKHSTRIKTMRKLVREIRLCN